MHCPACAVLRSSRMGQAAWGPVLTTVLQCPFSQWAVLQKLVLPAQALLLHVTISHHPTCSVLALPACALEPCILAEVVLQPVDSTPSYAPSHAPSPSTCVCWRNVSCRKVPACRPRNKMAQTNAEAPCWKWFVECCSASTTPTRCWLWRASRHPSLIVSSTTTPGSAKDNGRVCCHQWSAAGKG